MSSKSTRAYFVAVYDESIRPMLYLLIYRLYLWTLWPTASEMVGGLSLMTQPPIRLFDKNVYIICTLAKGFAL